MNLDEELLDFDENDERTPLMGHQPTSTSYLGLSSSSALSIPETTRVLQISNHVERELLNNDDQHHPQQPSTSSAHNKNYNTELREKLKRDYPVRYVLFNSVLTCSISALMILCERSQSNHFELSDLTVFSYRTLNGVILLGCGISLLHSLLAFLTLFVRRYFLIQLVAILNLIGCFLSFGYMIVINIVVLVFSLLGTDCDYVCILVRSSMILLGSIMTILNVTYFIMVQFNFLKIITIPTTYAN